MLNTLKKYGVAFGSTVTTLALTARPVLAGIEIGENITPGTGFASDIGSLINAVLTFVMVIAALLVFLYLIWGGIQWITSGGDKGKTEEARNKITAAIIGLIVLAASYALLLVILRFIGFEDLNDVFDKTQNINE